LRRRGIEAELKRIEARVAERAEPHEQLRKTVNAYQARVEAVPRRESEWTELTRDYATLERVYTGLLAKNQESRLAANLERQRFGEQLRVAERPVAPSRPVSPNRPRLLLIGVLVGLVLGLAILGAFEVFDTGLRGESEVVAALRVPVLAMVPVMTTREEQRRARYRLAAGSVLVLLILLVAVVWRSV
jgi:uncharacterized protein involved in exopolysaccharide biosynthesis